MGNDILGGIEEIRQKLESREIGRWTPDQLSRAMTMLAIFNMSLGELVVEAYRGMAEAESTRKVCIAQREAELAKTMSLSGAKTLAEAESGELRDVENKAVYQYKLLYVRHADTEALISVLQSRLKQLGNEVWEQKNNLEPEAIK